MSRQNGKANSINITWRPDLQVYKVTFEADQSIFHQVVRALKSIDFELRSYNADTRAWYIQPSELEKLREIAVRLFENAQLTEGDITTDLHSGRATQQLRLFD